MLNQIAWDLIQILILLLLAQKNSSDLYLRLQKGQSLHRIVFLFRAPPSARLRSQKSSKKNSGVQLLPVTEVHIVPFGNTLVNNRTVEDDDNL